MIQYFRGIVLVFLMVLPLQPVIGAEFIHFESGAYEPALQKFNVAQSIALNNWQIKTHPDGAWQDALIPFYTYDKQRLTVRCRFSLPDKASSDNYSLIGFGTAGSAHVRLNGQQIHFQSNGGVPFRIGLKNELLKSENVLEMELFRSKSALHGFPLYVNLLSEPQPIGLPERIYIVRHKDFMINNLRFRVTKSSAEEADIACSFDVSLRQQELPFRLEILFRSPAGRTVVRKLIRLESADQSVSVSAGIPADLLWSPDNPQLLSFAVNVQKGFSNIASYTTTIGLRDLNIDRDRIFINNKQLLIKGINYYINPTSYLQSSRQQILRRDLNEIKSLGLNAIRLPHRLAGPFMLHLADSLGLMVFDELPVWRYPVPLFQDDNLLDHAKRAIMNISAFYENNPSLSALSIGQEIPIQDVSVQKFMFILKGIVNSQLDVFSYLSPSQGSDFPPERAADFYILDIYHPLQSGFLQSVNYYSAFSLAGKAGILKNEQVYEWDRNPSNIKRSLFLTREVNRALTDFNFAGGFIESFNDWRAAYPTYLTALSGDKTLVPFGLYDVDGTQKHWVKNLEGIWEKPNESFLSEKNDTKKSNFFSILMVFSSIIFFLFYRQNARLRDNLRRAIRNSYGFFVDMRERRIIPLFNSLLIGLFAATNLAAVIGAYVYYYNDSYIIQEIISVFLIPLNLFEDYLLISRFPWSITLFFVVILLLYPIIVSLILKIISLFSSERIRYRQALAIGLWSGIPLIFMIPFSLTCYHVLYYWHYESYILYVLLFFILWAHIRIINGIRVLFITRPVKVLLVMLLSYIIPFIIFWAVFKPAPYWYDYLNLLLNARGLF